MTKEEREKAIEIFIKRAKCRATSTDDIIEGTDRKCCETTCDLCPLYYEDDELYEAERTAIKELKQEPREHGEWIEHHRTDLGEKLNDMCECSRCNTWFSISELLRRSFCPNCGADMRKQEG